LIFKRIIAFLLLFALGFSIAKPLFWDIENQAITKDIDFEDEGSLSDSFIWEINDSEEEDKGKCHYLNRFYFLKTFQVRLNFSGKKQPLRIPKEIFHPYTKLYLFIEEILI
jgi:hypothetical protein